jgi:hypothetical protein
MALSAGSKLGPYEILAPLGAGGMGEVYRAKDPRLGREVAIKVLPSSFSADADRLRRFEQEARAAGILNHPNITAVYDIGTHEEAPYVVQELLEGETLRSLLAGGRLPITPRGFPTAGGFCLRQIRRGDIRAPTFRTSTVPMPVQLLQRARLPMGSRRTADTSRQGTPYRSCIQLTGAIPSRFPAHSPGTSLFDGTGMAARCSSVPGIYRRGSSVSTLVRGFGNLFWS